MLILRIHCIMLRGECVHGAERLQKTSSYSLLNKSSHFAQINVKHIFTNKLFHMLFLHRSQYSSDFVS